MQFSRLLPDITNTQHAPESYSLQWVGMEDIAVPILFNEGDRQQQKVSAKANVYVSLDDTTAKGIHMSRLHAHLNQLSTQTCDKEGLDLLLKNLVFSQEGISQSSKIDLTFDLLLPKESLLSNETGFQTYPIEIRGQQLNGRCHYGLKITVPYSSTCPCSASLANQLFANAIDNQFLGQRIQKQELISWAHATTVATPHGQRSFAYLNLSLGDNHWPSLPSLIAQIEETIGTPVQTMVKRSDEQEFARLNADNLMFCEDAARKIKCMLEQSDWALDYWFKVEHQESLHAHNAVVIDQKY
ncbi:MAG: GTP cyclohydrolase I FolE2 [Candidatus Nitronauta litoralis]|uniref:GTP cyclohydrolase FolE2 n=1 Tax=Candidatus Nitronauta litoralis TaxID=2705533 RepID=A0A7T0BX31_9BACT|nr:MAG: GTP cyclohydrolase I FolE2 [Candidatus Nitronauta litoralis]